MDRTLIFLDILAGLTANYRSSKRNGGSEL